MRARLEAKLAAAQGKLDAAFLDRFDLAHSSIQALEERTRAVEQDFGRCRDAHLRELQGQCAENCSSLRTLQQAYSKEISERQGRESLLLAALGEVERRAKARLEQEVFKRNQEASDEERHLCNRRLDQLSQDIATCARELEAARARFRGDAVSQLEKAKSALMQVSKAREQADDDIVAALNHYTTDMQRALCSVSTGVVRAAASLAK